MEDLIGLYSRMSSAYRTTLAPKERGRSEIEFIKIINRRGPRMEPWGTPEGAATRLEDSPSKTTHCCLFVR